eukprot:1030245-Rhodomonas_salina.7
MAVGSAAESLVFLAGSDERLDTAVACCISSDVTSWVPATPASLDVMYWECRIKRLPFSVRINSWSSTLTSSTVTATPPYPAPQANDLSPLSNAGGSSCTLSQYLCPRSPVQLPCSVARDGVVHRQAGGEITDVYQD